MAHTYTNLLAHVIFSTKMRAPLIDAELRERLFPYMGGIIRELGGKALAINGTADHVHVLLLQSTEHSIEETMRVVKANSSRWIHEQWPQRGLFAWQRGYGAFSVSRSHVPTVVKYIREQEEHHRKMSFDEEFRLFLKRHGVEYEPQYLWR